MLVDGFHKEARMRDAIGYIRGSTRQQGRSGLALEAQQAALAKFAEAEGFRRRARPELVYRLVPSRATERERSRRRAREVVEQLVQRLAELPPCDAEFLMQHGVGRLLVERRPR
jgi:hypothetical protein